MSGETEREPSGWTSDTLKVLEDEKIEALERYFASELKRVEAVIAGQERAVTLLGTASQIAQDKFEATVRDGFVKQNEFRGSLDDLGKTMATRRELEAALLAISQRIDDLGKQVGDLRSRVDVGPAQLHALQSGADTAIGRQQGIGVGANVIAWLVGALIAGTSLVSAIYFATHKG